MGFAVDDSGNVSCDDLAVAGTISPPRPRSELESETFNVDIPLTNLRVHDAPGTVISSAGSDDLGLAGTFNTNPMYVSAGDLGAAGSTTRYARFSFTLPEEYVAASAITVKILAGMLTAISDGTCTLDVECYANDGDCTVTGDKCSTAAQSMNSLTFATYSFTITPTGLSKGQKLDFRIAIACADAATAVVEPAIDKISISLTVKG